MFKTDEIVLKWMSLDHTKYVNIGLGNGFVPSGKKPLPELMLSKSMLQYSHMHTYSIYGYIVSWVSR